MITKEKVLEILEQNSILSRTAGRVVIYENDWENIAEEIVKNCSIPYVVKSLPNDDEIEQAANENADRIFGDDVESNNEWYAMQHGFIDGVAWIKNYLDK